LPAHIQRYSPDFSEENSHLPSYLDELLAVDAEIRGLIRVALEAARRRPKPDDEVILLLEKALDLSGEITERGIKDVKKEGAPIGDDLYASFDGYLIALNTYEPRPQTLHLTKEAYGNLAKLVAARPSRFSASEKVGRLLWGFLWGVAVTLLCELALTLYYATPHTW